MMTRAHLSATVFSVVAVGLGGASSAIAAAGAGAGLTIKSQSVRADLVSGERDLLEITLPAGVTPGRATLTVNGATVTGALHPAPQGSIFPAPSRPVYLAPISGLRVGRNAVTVTVPGATARLIVTDHRWGTPVFSGPQAQPWTCTTTSNGLAAPTDGYCNAPSIVRYYYMPSGLAGMDTPQVGGTYPSGEFQSYDPSNPPPASSVATVMTDTGQVVPYIVRYEVGTADRGIYDLAILAKPGEADAPWSPPPGWDHKLTYVFGGGCGLTYTQGSDTGNSASSIQPASALDDWSLARGRAVLFATTATTGENCQTVTMAETVMETEERLTDEYGPIRFTSSYGCSGGAIGPTQIADAYPGLINGVLPHCSYSDLFNPLLFGVMDCSLLQHWFTGAGAADGFTPAQIYAVEGEIPGDVNCAAEESGVAFPAFTTTGSCAGSASYSASDPHGVQCDLFTRFVNELGRNAQGYVNRPADNVGVQYGLVALSKHEITPQQFADLNSGAGGIDSGGGYQSQRTVGSLVGIRRMYANDLIMYGRELGKIPDFDARDNWQLDMHDNSQWMFTRNRLLAHNGNANNQIHWFSSDTGALGTPSTPMIRTTEGLLDQWLSSISTDPRGGPQEARTTRDKPQGLTDECFVGGQSIPWTSGSQCDQVFSYAGDPRMAAGGPDTNDVLKCQLKPLSRADYGETFTAPEWAELKSAFPTGVCDYSKPGVDEQPPTGPWLSYQRGPDGAPLGPAPVSHVISTPGCPAATGRLDGATLGPVSLGESRAEVRSALPHNSRRARPRLDVLCLTPAGIRVGYSGGGRVVLITTSNPRYRLAGVAPGTRLRVAETRLHLGRGLSVGTNTWYLIAAGPARGVLKVQHGVVEEVGIAARGLTRSRAQAERFLRSFG